MYAFLKVTQENTPPLLYCMSQTECPLTKKISLCCPRGTCLWSQCMKHNKGLTSKTHWWNKITTKKNCNYHEDVLSWYEIVSEMYNKTGRIRPRKLISGGSICCCENKAFVFEFVHAVLLIQTLDSLSMHVTSRALWHTTMPPPFPKY